jgi:hypothetical protein
MIDRRLRKVNMMRLMSRIVDGEVPLPEDQQAKKKEKPAAILTGTGAPLPPSAGAFPNDPATCQHMNRISRANATSAWWTCKDCGSRWQRTDETMEMRRQPRVQEIKQETTEGPPAACPKCSRPLRRITLGNGHDDIYGCTGYPKHCKFAVEASKLSTSPGTSTGAASSSTSRAPVNTPPEIDLTLNDTTEEEDIVMIMQTEARGQRRRRARRQ